MKRSTILMMTLSFLCGLLVGNIGATPSENYSFEQELTASDMAQLSPKTLAAKDKKKKSSCSNKGKGKVLANPKTKTYTVLSTTHILFKDERTAKKKGYQSAGTYSQMK